MSRALGPLEFHCIRISGKWAIGNRRGADVQRIAATVASPPPGASLRVAHFVQRYPPALGGSEAYFARLSRHLVALGNQVTVFTTDALDLEAFWSPQGRRLAAGVTSADPV